VSVLATVDSAAVVLGVVFGIPLTLVVLGVVATRPRLGGPILGLATLVAAGLVAVAVWGVFRPAGTGLPASELGPNPGGGVATGAPSPTNNGGGGPPASCSPGGSALKLTAKAIQFDPSCLAAAAGVPFIIQFQNDDAGVPHNVHVFAEDPTADPSAKSLFTGTIVTGPTSTTYRVSALPAGSYFFHCDVHPTTMKGRLVVK
jgi:plastocyanin